MAQIMNSTAESLFKLRKIAGLARAWPYFWLAILIIIVMALHFSAVFNPPEHVFDESWYVSDANLILEGKGSFIPQHPPLGRLIIAGGIAIFGDNPLGWRFFPIIFGAVGLVLFYLICRQLKMPEKPAFLATFFLSIENLSFIQSSIAMLDVLSVTFMLAGFYAFLKNRWYLSGFLVGVSALAKFTGVLAIPVIGLYWLITSRKSFVKLGLSFLTVPVTYLAGLSVLLFVIWGRFLNPITETVTMLKLNSYSTFSVISSNMLSRPWEWLFGYKIITYYQDPHYIAAISSTIWALAVPAILYMAYLAYKGNRAAAFSATWFAGCYLLWIPISLITDRTSYVFYFYPVIGALSMAIALLLTDISARSARYSSGVFKLIARGAIPLYILMHIACFVFLAPVPSSTRFIGGAALYILMRFALPTEDVVIQNEEQTAAT
jgi:predicted membrane-bound dolichyl-phosphate-mannose-protein mannosyltransferase